jgi:hypothetical protein
MTESCTNAMQQSAVAFFAWQAGEIDTQREGHRTESPMPVGTYAQGDRISDLTC